MTRLRLTLLNYLLERIPTSVQEIVLLDVWNTHPNSRMGLNILRRQMFTAEELVLATPPF